MPKGFGGCLVYVKRQLKLIPINEKVEDHMETIWSEMCIHSLKMMIGTLYDIQKTLNFTKR